MVEFYLGLHLNKQIYEIYNHRIKNSSFINGSINISYLSLEEYLIIYFLQQYKFRRVAEEKLSEFIVSLKYYTNIWPRAKIFSKLAGMLQHSESIEKGSNYSADIYMQEFFYFAYS